MAEKRALITGITGQDGAYLAQLLLSKGYIVHGIKRRSSQFNTARIDHLIVQEEQERCGRFVLHYGDLTDATNLIRIIQEVQPDEIYNLGAQSHVAVSFETPEYTAQVDGLGTLRILEAIRILGLSHKTKFYQASTSELFGNSPGAPYHEQSLFAPRSPYAVAKLYAYWITVNYREAYQMFACNGILFNHESALRGETFVTRKITRAAARVALGMQDELLLGNLDAERDWGHAYDYVRAMWLMLQHETAEDFVIASGHTHTVRAFVEKACAALSMPIVWQGNGKNEIGVNAHTGKTVIRVHERYYRPTEVDYLCGDASKARRVLGWHPTITFDQLVNDMVAYDYREAQRAQKSEYAVQAARPWQERVWQSV